MLRPTPITPQPHRLSVQDATTEFEALHSSKAWKLLEDYYVGEVEQSPQDAASTKVEAKIAGPPIVLTSNAWVKLPLESRTELSHDTRLLRFALPTKEHRLGLPVGQHLFLKGKSDEGKMVMRAYTPVGEGLGYVDFVIKASILR